MALEYRASQPMPAESYQTPAYPTFDVIEFDKRIAAQNRQSRLALAKLTQMDEQTGISYPLSQVNLAEAPALATVEEVNQPEAQEITEPETVWHPGTEQKEPDIRFSHGQIAWGGVKRALAKANQLRMAAGDRFNLYSGQAIDRAVSAVKEISSAEHQTARRRTAKAVGGLALTAAAAFGVYKGYSALIDHNHANQAQDAYLTMPAKPRYSVEIIPTHAQPVAEAVQAPVHQAPVAVHVHPVHRVVASVKAQTDSLKFNGDSIWSHVQDKVRAKYGSHNLTELTRKFTDKTLKLNHLNWSDAKHMSVGQKFKLPSQLG
ncbi:hypothetical protein KW801_02475 [Candidatus Saccharibacteria bacterium]|nr:hypothetical protein [Candidatus Saccharibacteria bacterium]